MANYQPPVPDYQHDAPLFTFEDAVEHVLDAFSLTRKPYDLRVARRAVLDAYRDLANRHSWSYYERRSLIRTEAPQSTGTIVYDHTGGTYEREVTLTGATWPTNAKLWGLLIGEQQYMVEDYKTSTVITLVEGHNPGADVASTAYTLFRSIYPLPTNFKRGSALVELEGAWWPKYTSPTHLLNSQVSFQDPTDPYEYTIRSANEYYGGMVVEFGPPPVSARVYDFIYEAAPRPLRYERESVGTVSLSSTTVTGVGTNFQSSMVGSVIRFPLNSENTVLPTSVVGSVGGSDSSGGVYNPFAAERVITAVASTTSLTIDSTVSETVSGSTYTISDVVDVEPHAMLSAFKAICETKYATYAGKEDRLAREAADQRATRLAMESDSRHRNVGQPWGGYFVDPRLTITTDA